MPEGNRQVDHEGRQYLRPDGSADVCDVCCSEPPLAPRGFQWPAIVPDWSGNPKIMYQEDASGTTERPFGHQATNAAGSAWGTPFVIGPDDFEASPGPVDRSISAGVLGATATNAGYHFLVGQSDDATPQLRIQLASNAAGTAFTEENAKTAEAERVAGAIRLSSDKLGILTYNTSRSPRLEWELGNADGDSWANYAGPDGHGTSQHLLAEIDGRPAVWSDGDNYTRASNADGTSWPGTPNSIGVSFPQGLDMIDLDGVAALAITYDGDDDKLYCVVADNAAGSSWGTPVEITDAAGAEGNDSVIWAARLTYDGSRLYCHWTTDAVIDILDDEEYCTPWSGYFCYYPTIGYTRAVYESYSDDDGATWSSPAIKWSVDYGLAEGYNANQGFGQLDVKLDGSNNPHAVWCYLYSGGSDPKELIYDGNVIESEL